jgi:ABC-type multidrug transport system fused ATPase/permease subunit
VLGGRAEPDDVRLTEAVHQAAAADVVAGLPGGLDAVLANQAHTVSGGQRQRLRLARALLADPEVLVLVEPTAAVDAHTESVIAERLRRAREGRTTVVVSSSPLVLNRADEVAYLVDGRVVAAGSHAELLAREPGYRRLVYREADPDRLTSTPGDRR